MMNSINPTSQRVLRLLGHGPLKGDDLVRPGLARASVHRALVDLFAADLMSVDDKGVYTATKKGRAWLDARLESQEIAPELPIPALALVPTDVHRSLLMIGLCTTVRRTHHVAERNLAGFLLVDGAKCFKTTMIAQALVIWGSAR